jgi:HEAT repeat protein
MNERIRNTFRRTWLLWLCALCAPFGVSADTAPQRAVVYDRALGELSPGTEAPTQQRMVNAIRSASPTALTAMLEYGERVECLECVPLLEKKLLEAGDPRVREMAAWWLRRRPFGYGRAAVRMRETLLSDGEPVRRSRAAEALGEFLDVSGLPALSQAAVEDAAPEVRLASVRALGRLNALGGHDALATAFEDEDVSVRRAALDQVLRVNFWRNTDAVIARLDDEDAKVRQRAAQLAGELRAEAAAVRLGALLQDDPAAPVRQAAAWALGRIGGADARSALRGAAERETDEGVLNAVTIATAMAARS